MPDLIINLVTIANKRVVTNPDKSQIVELGESVFQYNKQANVRDVLVVTKDLAGKPWSIASVLYGNEAYLAPFFFLNGYPNPYAVDQGDKLLEFDESSLNDVITDCNNITKEINNVSPPVTKPAQNKSTVVDQNRMNVLNKLGATPATVVSPNQNTGVPSLTAADGVIVLGTDVSDARCKSNLTDTQTRTEQIRAAIKAKLGVTK